MGKKAERPAARPFAQPPRKFPLWWILPAFLALVLAVTVLAIGWSSEYDALREADNTPAEMVPIPGGTFVMGRDDGPPDEKPAHEVTVGPFEMDATEVTVGQFAAF